MAEKTLAERGERKAQLERDHLDGNLGYEGLNDLRRITLQERDEAIGVIKRAQAILAAHLPPDGPSDTQTLSELFGLLDGPEALAITSNGGDQ